MEINKLHKLFLEYPHISIDSRKVVANSIFFALKGDNNGNKYAEKALSGGASFAVVDEPKYAKSPNAILVEDSLNTLQNLASYHRKYIDITIIAITGTNGKTTTKELVSCVLSKRYTTGSTSGNLNNHIGVPLTLLSFDRSMEFGVVEMGASHSGEIAHLCKIVDPDFGIITNVGKAHLDGFGSFEAIKKTKAELYTYLAERGRRIFINRDNLHLTEMAKMCMQVEYSSLVEGNGLKGTLLQSVPMMHYKAKFPKGWLYIKSKLAGGYNFENALAATCIGQYFNVDPLDIKKAIEEYEPQNSRSQYKVTAGNRLLIDCYNANPSSMKAAIESFAMTAKDKKAVVLGDMLELGSSSPYEHQQIVDYLVTTDIQKVFLVGELFSSCRLPGGFMIFSDVGSLKKYFCKNQPLSGYSILIKGSRGIELENIVEAL